MKVGDYLPKINPNAGRKPKFRTAQELRDKIDDYFEYIKGVYLKDINGNIVLDDNNVPIYTDTHHPTMTGLARHLGFTTRKGLQNYKAKAEYCEIINAAKLRIEEYNEEQLYNSSTVNGAKFNLINNYDDWSNASSLDKEEQRIRIAEAKARIEQIKVKTKLDENQQNIQDDGFLQALEGKVSDVWQ